MIFAQTELSPLAPDIAAPGGFLFSNSFWWLVVTTLAVVAMLWILRTFQRPVPSKVSGAKSTEGSSVVSEDWKADNVPSKEKRPSGKKSKSKKSKKAGQTKTPQRSQPSASVVEVQSIQAEAVVEAANEPESQVEPARAALVPVAPIFEPLQQVGALRRVSIPEPEKGRNSANDSEKVEATRPLNVPFEKLKKASPQSRVSKNRWANFASEEPVQSIAVQSPAIQVPPTNETPPVPKTRTETISIPAEPTVRAPQGLKGFVSKLKNSNAAADN